MELPRRVVWLGELTQEFASVSAAGSTRHGRGLYLPLNAAKPPSMSSRSRVLAAGSWRLRNGTPQTLTG